MKGYIGLVLLVLGIVVASAFGSRNGDRHVRYRQASAKVDAGNYGAGVVQAGKELNATLKAEGIDIGALTMQEFLDLPAKEERLAKQIEANEEMLDTLTQWGLDPQSGDVEGFLHAAKAERDAIGLPQPGERMSQWFEAGGLGWLAGIVLIVLGAMLARLQQREDNSGGASGAVGAVDFGATMTETLGRVARIAESIADLPMDGDATAPRGALDALAADVLEPLVEGRGQLIAKHGLAGFAEYFGPFSAGERNLNRAWSALTDGHSVVAREAMGNARVAFEAAQKAFEAVEARG